MDIFVYCTKRDSAASAPFSHARSHIPSCSGVSGLRLLHQGTHPQINRLVSILTFSPTSILCAFNIPTSVEYMVASLIDLQH